ncbi:MAG: M15 family metallopeptidase [Ignavibacteriaceae bacterium]
MIVKTNLHKIIMMNPSIILTSITLLFTSGIAPNLWKTQNPDSSLTSSAEIADQNELIIDSDLTIEEALQGKTLPKKIKDSLTLIDVEYYSFDGKLHRGQVVIHKSVAQDITEIFDIIKKTGFPIEKVIPISQYNWSDEASMQDNNTSAFNYRFISGSKILSMHAQGLAIDINPKLNPYIKNHLIAPEGASYNTMIPGTIDDTSRIVAEFKIRGWQWGGDWKKLKDYQHFEKRLGN